QAELGEQVARDGGKAEAAAPEAVADVEAPAVELVEAAAVVAQPRHEVRDGPVGACDEAGGGAAYRHLESAAEADELDRRSGLRIDPSRADHRTQELNAFARAEHVQFEDCGPQ